MRVRFVGELLLGLCILIAGARRVAAQTSVAANYDFVLHELTETSWLGAHGVVTIASTPREAVVRAAVVERQAHVAWLLRGERRLNVQDPRRQR